MAKERIEDEVELIMHIRGKGLDGGSNFLAFLWGFNKSGDDRFMVVKSGQTYFS